MADPIRVTVWHEYRHEKTKPDTVGKLYPNGMHTVIKQALEEKLGDAVKVTTATLDQDDHHGLSDELLANTDVMTWWGHCAHKEVKDEIASKVAQKVREGMGFVVLHSGHYSKPFKMLMGTNCHLKWREAGEIERLYVTAPGHPITAGLQKDYIELPETEMYGEHFDIPHPDEQIFISWFEGGDVFRSGNVWRRGAGRVFYFRPGHETFPIYYNDEVRQVIANGVRYVAPIAGTVPYVDAGTKTVPSLSPIASDHQVDESLHDH